MLVSDIERIILTLRKEIFNYFTRYKFYERNFDLSSTVDLYVYITLTIVKQQLKKLTFCWYENK